MITDSVITTGRLKILPFDKNFLTKKYVGWLNDKDTMKFSDQRFFSHTLKTCEDYWNSIRMSDNSFWAITYHGDHIGNLTVYMDKLNGVADISIMIGEKEIWGQGFGLEAWLGICSYLFDIKKVRKITAGTLEINYGMLSIMKKANMQPDGIRLKHCLVDGKEFDMVHMALFNPQL